MALRIDRKLNIVFELESPDGRIFVHASPISREVFETYFMVISKTFSRLYAEGMILTVGPRMAGLLLKKTAIEMGVWDTPDGVQKGLINEIHRLANVTVLGNEGWRVMPLHDAIRREMLSEGDVTEVNDTLIFFTCVSCMVTRNQLPGILVGMQLWGTLTTSLNCTEYAASLPISTPDENSGAKKPADLSIPY